MKKNILKKKLRETVIPRLTGNPAENKAILPLDTRIKPEYDNQSGRSMVEMLGVLAVIGVLSVAGISAYSTAMNKHRANELLNEASKRATVVAMQVASGRTGLTVAEFGNDGWNVTTDGLTNQFGIVSPSVSADACKQVVNAIGAGTVIKQVLSGATDATGDASKCSDNSITFIYNNDMSTGSGTSGGNGAGNPEPPACTLTASDCPSGVDTTNCVCESTAGQKCTSHSTNQCGLGYYCQFSPSTCSASGEGVCTQITGGTEIIPVGDTTKSYLKKGGLDWWSAYSWCIGNNMNLVTGTIAGHSLNSSYSNNKGGDFYTYFGRNISFWTGYDYGDSCHAWSVSSSTTVDTVEAYGRDDNLLIPALCE